MPIEVFGCSCIQTPDPRVWYTVYLPTLQIPPSDGHFGRRSSVTSNGLRGRWSHHLSHQNGKKYMEVSMVMGVPQFINGFC